MEGMVSQGMPDHLKQKSLQENKRDLSSSGTRSVKPRAWWQGNMTQMRRCTHTYIP